LREIPKTFCLAAEADDGACQAHGILWPYISGPVTGIIGTNPLARFADWKLPNDEAGLKGEAYLPQTELIRKDAFPY
jgi:hypothetical protein